MNDVIAGQCLCSGCVSEQLWATPIIVEGQHPIHSMLAAVFLSMQCRVSRPVKTKPRTCISRFYYIVTTISIGEKTGAGEGFSHDYYHCSGLNKLLRLIGFRHVDYHGFGTQKLGAG